MLIYSYLTSASQLLLLSFSILGAITRERFDEHSHFFPYYANLQWCHSQLGWFFLRSSSIFWFFFEVVFIFFCVWGCLPLIFEVIILVGSKKYYLFRSSSIFFCRLPFFYFFLRSSSFFCVFEVVFHWFLRSSF